MYKYYIIWNINNIMYKIYIKYIFGSVSMKNSNTQDLGSSFLSDLTLMYHSGKISGLPE